MGFFGLGGSHPDPRHDPLYHEMLAEAKSEELSRTRLRSLPRLKKYAIWAIGVLVLLWIAYAGYNVLTDSEPGDPLVETTESE